MEHFRYFRAASIAEAVNLLNEPGVSSCPLAGGTDLLLLARHGRICDRVVDITHIPELHRIGREGQRITIGAGATFSEVIESPVIQETTPLLVQACRQVGAVQIRNMGTLGGNVANAAACADSLPALVCLDAEVTAFTTEGLNQWLVSELISRPNQTLLQKGTLLVSLSYLAPLAGSQSIFFKLGRRNALAISRLTLAALGRLDGAGKIIEARIVPGAITPQIHRLSGVEESLAGQIPSEELFQEAGRLTIEEVMRITERRWSSEYKEPALQVLVVRALRQIFGLGGSLDRRAA
jgi:CO/xanthine dehydrogenase FAD-binding subunit